jgi:protein gp37
MNKTKIDWAEYSWNPLSGCLNNCEYCYARKIANRFGTLESNSYDVPDSVNEILTKEHGVIVELNERLQNEPYPYNFVPTFHKYRLEEPFRKTNGVTIFVCSMADLFGEQYKPGKRIHNVYHRFYIKGEHTYF